MSCRLVEPPIAGRVEGRDRFLYAGAFDLTLLVPILPTPDLDFLGQLRLVRNARHIVAPDGSALFLGYFARPGTKLCILTHPLIFMMQTETALLSGVEVTLFTGPYIRKKVKSPEESDYQIDESRFCAFLEDWLKAG